MATTFDTVIRMSRSSMLIVCPQCATSYDLTASALGEGRSVRCTRCRTIWFASAQEMALEAAGAPDAGGMVPDSPDEAGTGSEAEFDGETPEPVDTAAEFAADTTDIAPEADPAAGQDQAAPEDPGVTDVIDGAPPLVPALEHERQFVPGEGPFPITGGDVETFARRRASKRAKKKRGFPALPKLRWPLAALPTLLLGLCAAVAILLGWRADAVRLLPQTASLYSAIGLGVNLRGLVFENIKTSREIHEGIPVMVVEGEIVSVSRKAVEVPRLRFGVRNGLGGEIYNWTAMPSRTIAGPGDRLPFRSRLASPPAETHDISVRFYNRRDAAAGLR